MKNKLLMLTIISIFVFLWSGVAIAAQSIVPPNEEKIQYIGRIDTTTPNAYQLVWPGTTIIANFQGTSLKLKLTNDVENYLNVFIDEKLTILKCENGEKIYTLATDLSDTTHVVRIFKRTEAWAPLTFQGFILDSGKQLADPPARLSRRIEFYGDSITAGACNEDPGDDQWSDHSTHNNYMAYGAIAARQLDAEYMCTAISGIGMTIGYIDYLMPQVWDKVEYSPSSKAWNFDRWKPDVVVVNLGQNDKSKGPKGNFKAAYTKLIHNIRSKYPNAEIFCVLGPMDAGIDPTFINYVYSAVKDINASGDKKVYFHKFSQFTGGPHPRVSTHQQVADELDKVIKEVIWN